METKQVNLKERLMAIYKKQWKKDHLDKLNKLKAQQENRAQVEKEFKAAYPEFYDLLIENGLYQGFTTKNVGGSFEEEVLVIGTVEDSFTMRFHEGKIQPREGASFDVWGLDKLLEVIDSKLKIISKDELDQEYMAFMEVLN